LLGSVQSKEGKRSNISRKVILSGRSFPSIGTRMEGEGETYLDHWDGEEEEPDCDLVALQEELNDDAVNYPDDNNNNNNIYLVWPQRGTWLHRTTARRAGGGLLHAKYPIE
jgi:hypothetical protein